MKLIRLGVIVISVLFIWCITGNSYAQNLVWQTSKDTAVSTALSQGKHVLLLAGRDTCGNCLYMKNTVCESISPPIRDLIENSFIPWFCNIDSSTEWYTYASGLGSFYLPLICVIDPNDEDNFLDRTTNVQPPQVFYERLLQYPPLDTDEDEVPDSIENFSDCLNNSDADSDDDGLLDGEEDTNQNGIVDEYETDPCAADTDGDGIQDGTESGVTIGHPTDTDDSFIPDADGGITTTCPLDADSDDDGLLDGEEDTDFDGIVDVGETDPNVPDRPNVMPWIPLLLVCFSPI